MMVVSRIAIGTLLLALGNKLFWLFVASVGFLVGLDFANRFFHLQPEWLVWLIALAAGLIGAVLAVFAQGLAIYVAGFLGGGYLALFIADFLGWSSGRPMWILFVICGILGGILFATLFDWALILLSSISGATLIVQAVQLRGTNGMLVFLLLVFLGVVIQSRMRRLERVSS